MQAELLDGTTYYDFGGEKKKSSFWYKLFVGCAMVAMLTAVWYIIHHEANPTVTTKNAPVMETKVGEASSSVPDSITSSIPKQERDCLECADEFVASGGCDVLFDEIEIAGKIPKGCAYCGKESARACIGTGRDCDSCATDFKAAGGCHALSSGNQAKFVPKGCFDCESKIEKFCERDQEVTVEDPNVDDSEEEVGWYCDGWAKTFYDPEFDWCDCGKGWYLAVRPAYQTEHVVYISPQGSIEAGMQALDFRGYGEVNEVEWTCDVEHMDWHQTTLKYRSRIHIASIYQSWKWHCSWTSTGRIVWTNFDYKGVFKNIKLAD